MIQRQKKLQLKKQLEMILDKFAEKKKNTTWSRLKKDVFSYFTSDEVWEITKSAIVLGYTTKKGEFNETKKSI